VLQRYGIQFRVLSMRHPRRAARRGEHPLQLGNQPFSGDGTVHHVQQRHPRVFVVHRGDLDRLPPIVQSNWNSCAHNAFGASASTTGAENFRPVHVS
jgi:hypothetical protein